MFDTNCKFIPCYLFIIFIIQLHSQSITYATDSLEQKQENEFRHYHSQNIIISTSRFNEDVKEVSESVSMINSNYINNNFLRSTPELLIGVNGVWIQKTNHGGGSPFLRGLTGNQVLLMIDGFRLNNSITRYGPNQYFNTIDPLILNKIEVVRGAGSVLYGSDAIGGTIQVFTKQPTLNPEFQINGRLTGKLMSSNMEKSARAEIELSSVNFGIIGGLSFRDFGDISAGGDIGMQTPTGYDEISGNINFIGKVGDKGSLYASYQITNQNDVPLFHKIKLENYRINNIDVQRRQLAYVKFEQAGSNFILSSSVAYHQSMENRIKQKNGSNDKDYESDKINTYAIIFESLIQPIANVSISSGIDIYYDYVNSEASRLNTSTDLTILKRGLYPNGSGNLNLAIFSHIKYSIQRLNLFAGLRYNYNKIEFLEEVLGNIKIEPQAFVWSFGALYKLSDSYAITTNINTSFRAPNIDDLGTLGIVDFRYEIPNYDLRPERSLNYEVGLRYDANKGNIHISGFRTTLSDLVTRVKSSHNGQDSINGYQVFNKVNSAEAELYGIESDASSLILDWLMLSANITYIYGQDITKNEAMRRIPPLFGNFRTEFIVFEKLGMSLILDWAAKQSRLASGDKSDNRINPNGTPGWYSVNFEGSYRFNIVNINFGALNLLDKNYRHHGSGIDAWGRTFWLGLLIKL